MKGESGKENNKGREENTWQQHSEHGTSEGILRREREKEKRDTQRKNQGEMDSEVAKQITPKLCFGVDKVPERCPGSSRGCSKSTSSRCGPSQGHGENASLRGHRDPSQLI